MGARGGGVAGGGRARPAGDEGEDALRQPAVERFQRLLVSGRERVGDLPLARVRRHRLAVVAAGCRHSLAPEHMSEPADGAGRRAGSDDQGGEMGGQWGETGHLWTRSVT